MIYQSHRVSRGSLCSLVAAVLFTWSANAYACACCADSGVWQETGAKVSGKDFDAFKDFKFSATARLIAPNGDDEVKGIGRVADYSYKLALVPSPQRWSLEFTDSRGAKGKLFLIPLTTTSFATDLFDGSEKGGLGPRLYKEWRFEGQVGADSLFAQGITNDAKFRLIIQGRGNLCPNPEDFKHWKLQVAGQRAQYTFYGALQ
ncbi:MAG: hypothetical protein EXR70_20440 [Deltaproteobacteria bacterium]|nr:hypothetical protein [Deltaproteobacteria bacterium]